MAENPSSLLKRAAGRAGRRPTDADPGSAPARLPPSAPAGPETRQAKAAGAYRDIMRRHDRLTPRHLHP